MGWLKITNTIIKEDGSTRMIAVAGTPLKIEIRKRRVRPKGKQITWAQTTYMVMKKGKAIKACKTLKDAIKYVREYN